MMTGCFLWAQDRTKVRWVQIRSCGGAAPPSWGFQGVPASEVLSLDDYLGRGARVLLG